MNWWKFYQIFQRHDTSDPLSSSRFDTSAAQGAGIVGIDTIPDLRGGGFNGAQSPLRISVEESADFIDMTSVTGRTARYKEYDRLQMTAEIETALNTFADEACLAGETQVATPFGFISIAELAATKDKDEQFLVYCWDFDKQDYTLGWAFNPRLVKKAKTVKVMFDDGKKHIVTPDHRFLLRSGEWVEAGNLKYGDELMPFYRVPANVNLTKTRTKQFPRIYTFHGGWKHERQFIDEWSTGKADPKIQKINRFGRLFCEGLNLRQVSEVTGHYVKTIDQACQREGFSYKEFKWLANRFPPVRRVIGVAPHEEVDVYDLSVKDHENFATDATIVHNCQEDEQGRIFHITCGNEEVRKELDYILHRLLQIDDNLWNWAKNLYKYGDTFLEVIIDIENPKRGIVKLQMLPADSMYRIETIKGRLIEFQQSKEGPDYNSLARVDVLKATESELRQATALRFTPEQIIHMKIGDDRRTFYPYGVSMIEAARGPAHLLHLMEDAMLVYRLCLTGDTRVRTSESYKYIKDLQVGDEVFSYSKHGVEPTTVTYVKNNGTQPIFEVKSRHISIKGNATHPILVNRDGVVQYVDISDLQPKRDRLFNVVRDSNELTEIPRIIGEPWAKLSDEMRTEFRNTQYKNKSLLLRQCHDFGRAKQFLYCKGKALPLDKAKTICEIFGLDPEKLLIVNRNEYNSERLSLPKYVDVNFARLLGFMCGDGHLHNGSQLGFSISPDLTTNNYYHNLLTQYFGKVRFEADKRSAIGMGRYVVDSTTACRIFTELGYINDHHTNRIPNWVFTSPKSIRRAFIIGLSDADGCERYTKRGTWFSTIELCNKKLIEDIKELWASIGLCSGHIKERHRENGHVVYDHVIGPSISYSVTISDCLLPAQENILSVTAVGEEDVFDIGVDHAEHNFIANGTIVHNTRAPERRVFYIDVGQLPPFKAEAFIERMKDQFRKKKVFNRRGTQSGALAVDERYQPPAADEDYWLPMRQNSGTRIDTLPGAQNLGEIDDALYFRNKLYIALQFPKNYLSNTDPSATRLTLSQQDVRFARLIERLQKPLARGIEQIAVRHLRFRGWPEEDFKDLEVKLTPPSDWRTINRNEADEPKYNRAATMKGSQLMSDYDILVRILGFGEDEAKEIVARNKAQRIEELKLQVIGQNPSLMGLSPPEQDGTQIGASPGGPTPQLAPGQEDQGQQGQGPQAQGPEQQQGQQGPEQQGPPNQPGQKPEPQNLPELPEPSEEDIKKYNLSLDDIDPDQEDEEVDDSEVDGEGI